LIAQAESVKRIASRLGVTISTVYTYRARIFEKLGINSNVALTRYALTHGVGIVSLERLPGSASQILR
jgi:two-component system invasion response regulator UvrY